jgi:hypothetical protein
MDYSSMVQSVGRPGENFYVYSTPNYSPIQAIASIPSGQAGFSGSNENSESRLETKSKKPTLPEDYRSRAESIQKDVAANRTAIVPGMLLDIFA